ncbi:MAG: response regulator [Deltaproteobacteria bacterium]|jgi:CheY-like chemotaxis protein|nr:response regulator [Deltaproteobacteria bacterium]MBW2530560.1 response regulator [Deltaproteobacteria bacterium]
MSAYRESDGTAGERSRPPRFLIVDDDPLVLRQRRRILRSRCPHWQVYTAESGKAALEQLESRDYDVVCADLSMPQMDGIQLLQTIRKQYPQVVRMLCSGLAAGMDDSGPVGHLLHAVLDKAASTEQLIAALELALSYVGQVEDDEI